MNITQQLIQKANEKGINTDEVVYSICIGDVIECIAESFEEEALDYSDDKLKELIEKGIKGTEYISWSETITAALLT